MTIPPPRKFSLIRPSLETLFHIEYDWWKTNDRNWRVYLHSCLCPKHQEIYKNFYEGYLIDWVDPETAEVTRVDGLEHALLNHCSLLPDFLDTNMPLVDAVFRAFIAHHNEPMNSHQLADLTGKQPEKILATLAGPHIYKGIRPIH